MIDFLNQYSAGIQAISSTLSVIVTIVLVIITWKYVDLTKKMAETTAQQLEYIKSTTKIEINILLELSTYFYRKFNSILRDQNQANKTFRNFVTWEENDEIQLKDYLLKFQEIIKESPSIFITNLQYVKNKINEVKLTDSIIMGYNWDKFPWNEWVTKLNACEGTIQKIIMNLQNHKRGTS